MESKKMKIMGFIASACKTGNTAWVVNKILECAKENGSKTEHFYFNDLDIKPCQGFFGCKTGQNAGCVLRDDMRQVFAVIVDADAIILGSPLYMGQMSGQAKIFMDRLSSQFMPRFSPFYKERPKKKKLILVFTQGNPDTSMFQPYYDYTKKMLEMLEFHVELCIIAGMRNVAAGEKEDLHIEMKKIASSLTGDNL